MVDEQVKTDKGLATYPKCQFEEGKVDKTADDVLIAEIKSKRGPTRHEEAKEWLEDMLSGGSKSSSYIYNKAQCYGIKERTLNRAKDKIGVKTTPIRVKGKIYGWEWSLPKKESQVAKDS